MAETFEIKQVRCRCERCGKHITDDGIQNVPHGSRWTHYQKCP